MKNSNDYFSVWQKYMVCVCSAERQATSLIYGLSIDIGIKTEFSTTFLVVVWKVCTKSKPYTSHEK